MLLGVVLHGALFFMKGGGAAAWPLREGGGHGLFNLLVGWIHLFRMPAFFLLSGFFGALLWEKLGARGFLRHRARRVLLPLFASWIVLGPLVASLLAGIVGVRVGSGGTVLGAGTAAGGAALADSVWSEIVARSWSYFLSGAWLAKLNLMHLWFLWYLFLLCAGMWALLRLGEALPRRWTGRTLAWLEGLVVSRYNLVVFILLTAVTLRPMRTAAIATGTSLWPRWSILATYAVFFVVGWLWHRRREALLRLKEGWGWRIGVGSVLGVISTLFSFGAMAARERPSLALLVVTAAACWWMIFGLIGLFQRHFAAPWRAGRYLADASYWVYLIHIPVLIALAPILHAWTAPPFVKYLALVAGAFAACLVSYQWIVRDTWIGVLLNGARRGGMRVRKGTRGNGSEGPEA